MRLARSADGELRPSGLFPRQDDRAFNQADKRNTGGAWRWMVAKPGWSSDDAWLPILSMS